MNLINAPAISVTRAIRSASNMMKENVLSSSVLEIDLLLNMFLETATHCQNEFDQCSCYQ